MKREVDAAGAVALEDGVADVATPHRQALALALLKVAAAQNGPPRVAAENAPTRLHLIVEVREASEPRESSADLHERFELQRVHILPVARDVPAAREDEARARRRVVEHSLGRSGRVLVDASWGEHDEHVVASRDGAFNDLAIVRRSWDDDHAVLVRGESSRR